MSTPISRVPPFRPGMTQFDTADLNAMLAACRLAVGHNNTHGEIEWVETWLARIVTEGPAEEADYTDARYWVRRCRCSNDAGAQTVAPTFELVSTPMAGKYEGYWVTATNIAEYQAGSHLLLVPTDPPVDPEDSPVVVIYTIYDQQSPPIKRYYFQYAVSSEIFRVWVYVDGGTTDGDGETQCDRTYTVATAADHEVILATAKTPERARPPYGKLVCATGHGWAYMSSGSLVLWDANETIDVLEAPS